MGWDWGSAGWLGGAAAVVNPYAAIPAAIFGGATSKGQRWARAVKTKMLGNVAQTTMSKASKAEWLRKQAEMDRLAQQRAYSEQAQSSLMGLLRGELPEVDAVDAVQFDRPEGISPEAMQQFYETTIRDPAIQQYEDVTRPAWLEKVGSLHGSHRRLMEQKGYEDLYGGLEQQRGGLMFQQRLQDVELDKLTAERQFQANLAAQGLTADRQRLAHSGIMSGLGMTPSIDPGYISGQYHQQLIAGLQPTEYMTPGTPGLAGPLLGAAGTIGGAVLGGPVGAGLLGGAGKLTGDLISKRDEDSASAFT